MNEKISAKLQLKQIRHSLAGCTLELMSSSDEVLSENVLYLRYQDECLDYEYMDPEGICQKDSIMWQELSKNGAADELKPKHGSLDEFEAIKNTILGITSKRGHIPLALDISDMSIAECISFYLLNFIDRDDFND